ncbi:MAG TPA: glycosyltransferase [Vicinamibacterales bacterium]|nr:glycosyltransferase [Vicinamibacterales bacterium]
MPARARGLRGWVAAAVVGAWYAGTILLTRLWPRRRRPRPPSGCAVVVGTFHNLGWYLSHMAPLSRAGLREIVVVSDGELPALPGVRHEPPPAWLATAVGRTLAKFVWTVTIGRRTRADVFIGFHVIPNGTIALAAARLTGGRSCYQMTGGPIELIGGGYQATENQVLGRLRAPSRMLERLALAVTGAFDLVVVRGTSARRFVSDRTSAHDVAVIPGSVDLARIAAPPAHRRYDLIFVGRLAPTKQPLQFLDIAAAVRRILPAVRACIVGGGPMMDAVEARIAELGLQSCVEVTGTVPNALPSLLSARVFILTSRSEGLSIAMAEAMICGAVPVVADVGDLGDLVTEGETGFLIEPGNIAMYAERAAAILQDPGRWTRMSEAAARRAREYNGLEHVSQLWRARLGALGAAETPPAAALAASDPPLAAKEQDGR